MEYEDIVEIVTLRSPRKVNIYLEGKYRLLNICHVNELGEKENREQYVRRGVLYIVGRPTDVDQIAPPPDAT